MASTPYLVSLPAADAAPARSLINGVANLAINAESTADAVAYAKTLHGADVDALWDLATVTSVAPVANLNGWKMRLRIFGTFSSVSNSTPVNFDQTITADGSAQNTVAAIAASKTLVSSANYANAETVTVGGKTYTFQTVLTNVANNVFIGASEAASMANLVAAITAGAGAGTTYAAATTVNANVTASTDGVHTVTATALVAGAAGNAITCSETSATAAWLAGATTLSGGADATTPTTDKLSSFAVRMVALLNAAGIGITHASFNAGTGVLTIASSADVFGDHRVDVAILHPQADLNANIGIPGFVTAKTDNGIASAALSITLAADTYAVPTLIAKLGPTVS